MNECPVCGFNPNAVVTPLTEAQLRREKILNYFSKNLQNSWWISQPIEVCKWLKSNGISPTSILDAGCGDGRWLTGIFDAWPKVKYTGVDSLYEHIEMNRENLPEYEWIHNYLQRIETRKFDTVLMGGTLNPKMVEQKQGEFLSKIMLFEPKDIVCLFDLNQTGNPPDRWLDDYSKSLTYRVSKDEQGPGQDIVVWVYKRNEPQIG